MGHAERFVAAAGSRVSAPSPTLVARLEAELRAALARARSEQPAWLTAAQDEAGFVEHLGRSLPRQADPVAWLEKLHAGDFLLCWAAEQGREAAQRQMGEGFVVPACRLAAPGRVEELTANVTSHLLVPLEGGRPRIASYSGRGPLTAWVRMIAKRQAIDLHRGERRQTTQSQEFARLAMKVTNPELDFLKLRYAKQFNQALEEVLSELPTEDANLLYLTSVERVSSAAVAQMRNVSVRTVQRHLSEIRERILDQVRDRMRSRLQASSDEIESLLALVQSQLDVTLHRVLRRSEPGEPGGNASDPAPESPPSSSR